MLKYLFAAIIVFLLFIVNIIKNKISKDLLVILKTVLIVLFIEVTVFNINSYRTDFGVKKHFSFNEEDLQGRIDTSSNTMQYIYLNDINAKVKSVYIELRGLAENEIVDYDIYYADNSTSNRYLATKTYFQDVEKTKYSVISLSRRLQKFMHNC